MRLGSRVAAFLWGFAEATVFFIVPDVLLTCLAISSLKRAMIASLLAAVGATFGGMVMWLLASSAPETSIGLLLQIPGISDATIRQVKLLLQEGTYLGMLAGAFSGVPFKVFAAEAGLQGISLAQFALLTPFARFPRFIILSGTAWAISKALGHDFKYRHKLALTLTLWTVFYAIYFSLVGW